MPPSPLAVFEENISDAEQLLGLAAALANTRARAMRRELREAVGAALRIPKKRWKDLNCAGSEDVFVVMKPGGAVGREHFSAAQLHPLLRQVVVAISAAVETYVADKACEFIPHAIGERPPRLRQVSVNLVEVLELEEQYTRRGWGYRKILQTHLRDIASPAPSQIGVVFSTVGRKVEWAKLDNARKVKRGRSESELDALYKRRNGIAHQADRSGGGKRAIDIDDARAHLANARAIVEALEAQMTPLRRRGVISSPAPAFGPSASSRADRAGLRRRIARGSARAGGRGSPDEHRGRS